MAGAGAGAGGIWAFLSYCRLSLGSCACYLLALLAKSDSRGDGNRRRLKLSYSLNFYHILLVLRSLGPVALSSHFHRGPVLSRFQFFLVLSCSNTFFLAIQYTQWNTKSSLCFRIIQHHFILCSTNIFLYSIQYNYVIFESGVKIFSVYRIYCIDVYEFESKGANEIYLKR